VFRSQKRTSIPLYNYRRSVMLIPIPACTLPRAGRGEGGGGEDGERRSTSGIPAWHTRDRDQ
jgi:hypothetical protein